MAVGIWEFLSGQGFQPHGYCLMWAPEVFWTHVVSDIVIAAAYLSIPVAILHLTRKRRDLNFVGLPTLFAAFIVACGVTHLFGVWTMWVPSYGPEAIAKALTAGVSLATAVALWPLMPTLVAIPDVNALAAKNAELEAALRERERAELRLADANRHLEARVAERTGELNMALRDAEAASEAKTSFLATISHEIRTPLNGIVGMLEVLAHDGLAAEATRRVALARRSADTLLALLTDVLDFSGLERNALRLAPAPTAPASIVADVVDLHEPAARARGLTVVCDMALPDAEATWLLDPVRLRQILGNLVSNAVKFTDHGGVTVTVAVEPGPATDRLTFTVRDTGIGVPDPQRERLFHAFSQGDGSMTRRHGGAGLGLAICRRMVDLMGGEITLQESSPSGSAFHVSIPAERCAAAAAPAATAQDVGVRTSTIQFAQRVPAVVRLLMVEDDAANREVMAAILGATRGRRSFLVDVAASGREAVELARLRRYDVILMDIAMPEMDGVTATRRIREGGASCDTPVVAVTAYAMAGDREALLERGMSGYVAKPVLPDQLREAIYAAIARRAHP